MGEGKELEVDLYDLARLSFGIRELQQLATERLNALGDIPLLAVTERAFDVAEALLAASALPVIAQRDAQHIAVAAVNGVDFLVTWNCRHLANAMLRDRIEQVCETLGLAAPKLCTPEELFGEMQ